MTEKAANETKTVTGWIWVPHMKNLIYLTGCRDKTKLVDTCTVYLRMTKAVKWYQLAFLQDVVDDHLAI